MEGGPTNAILELPSGWCSWDVSTAAMLPRSWVGSGLEEVGASVEQASHAHVAGRLVGHLGLEGGAGGVKYAVGAQGAQLRAVEQRDCLLVVGGGDRVGRKDEPYRPGRARSCSGSSIRCPNKR